jgi:hypothetical protein
VSKRGGGNPKVVSADRFTSICEIGPDVRMHPGNGLGDRDWLQSRQQVLDECASLRAPSPGRPQDTMQQLADRDHADRPIFVPQVLLDLRVSSTSLEVD